MKKKQGISLIVLVITIIVMIVLAAAVVVTLSNTGIIGKANEATQKTNLKQVEQLAVLVWSEAFMDGLTGDELKEAVLDKLDDYTDEFDIDVTDGGVTVTPVGSGAAEKNEYGFYYNYLYVFDIAPSMGCQHEMVGIYINEENIPILCVVSVDIENNIAKSLEIVSDPLSTSAEVDKENRLLKLDKGQELSYSEDGSQITIDGINATVYTGKKITGMKRNTDYSYTEEGNTYTYRLTDKDEFVLYLNGVETQKIELTSENFLFENFILDVAGVEVFGSIFGDRIMSYTQSGVYEIAGTNNEIKRNVTYKAASGNTLTINDQNIIFLTKDGTTHTLDSHEFLGDAMWETGVYAIYSFAGGEIIAYIDADEWVTEYYRLEK